MNQITFQTFPIVHEKPGPQQSSFVLSTTRAELIARLLEQHMDEHKPFLKAGYSIRDLSDDLEVPAYQISAYLNRLRGMNFNDYLNQFRVKYCEELIRQGLVGQLNLRGLAMTCGFNNRNTLTTAFKKFTGYTPSHYSRSPEFKPSMA